MFTALHHPLPTHLTPREVETVKHIAECKSNKQIAFEMSVTVGTIKEYIFHIMKKTKLGNRTAIALWYVKSQQGDLQ